MAVDLLPGGSCDRVDWSEGARLAVGPLTLMRKLLAREAAENLDALIAEVVSRHEPVEIASAWGDVTLVPGSYLDAWRPLALDIVALEDPAVARVDAASHANRWDGVAALMDTDTGSWLVRTSRGSHLVDLDRRTISSRGGSGPRSIFRHREALAALIECETGRPAVWTVTSVIGGGPLVLRRSSGIVASVNRVDSGPNEATPPQPLVPTDVIPTESAPTVRDANGARISVSSDYASTHLEDLLADVASRLERIVVASPHGSTVLFSSSDFVGIVEAARVVLDVGETPDDQPDAGATTGEGDMVSELRDTDTGVWHVVTTKREYVLALSSRSVICMPLGADISSYYDRRYELVHLRLCRVDQPLQFETGDADQDDHIGPAADEVVRHVTRLDDWTF